MGIKYYYSVPQQIRQGLFLADAGGNPIYQFDNSTFVKSVPRVTICTILDGTTLRVGYSVCAAKDQYRRKIGMNIARERAMKKPYTIVEDIDMKKIHEISYNIVNEIFDVETKRIYGVSD